MLAVFVISALVIMILGAPVAMAIAGSSMIYILLSGIEPMMITQRIFAQINSISLCAIPFFILAGELMNNGGMAKRLMRLAKAFVGNRTGGLAMVAIIASMFFAAISGSTVATCAAIGSLCIPAMIDDGYDRNFASATVCCAGPIGGIIPPSVAFIIFCNVSNSSIADMYKVGFPTGIIMGLALMVVAYIVSKKRGYKGVSGAFSGKEVLLAFKEAIWALGTPIILIGGVFGGIFTPTESAAVCCVYGIIVGVFVYKELTWKDILSILRSSAKSSAKTMLIISCAGIFGYVLSYEKIPSMVVNFMLSLTTDKTVLLILIMILYLILGCFMETGATLIITVPLLLPIVTQLGMNPIHFGIVTMINLSIGQFTPPFGVCMFTSAMVGKTNIQGLMPDVMKYLVSQLIVLVLITFVPGLVMWIL